MAHVSPSLGAVMLRLKVLRASMGVAVVVKTARARARAERITVKNCMLRRGDIITSVESG
jgi:hypothetical protein